MINHSGLGDHCVNAYLVEAGMLDKITTSVVIQP